MTFAVFFLNADNTVYARYGTRTSHDSAERDVSLVGLAATMKSVLTLHKKYPDNIEFLKGKQPVATEFNVPEEFPALKSFKPELNYTSNVSKSCIHCHQVRDAARENYRTQQKPLPEKLLFPYPSPQQIGVTLETDSRATVKQVSNGSQAVRAGLRQGDELLAVNGQAICSTADLQWAMHQLDKNPVLNIDFRSGTTRKVRSIKLDLPANWKHDTDISWRTTTWDLRRMIGGGMVLKPLTEQRRSKLKIDADSMALEVTHVGKYGRHGFALKAGIRKGDVVVDFGGRSDLMTETAVLAYGMQNLKPQSSVAVKVLREGKPRTYRYMLQ